MTAERSQVSELLDLNQQLLGSIVQGDWDAYSRLCDPSISAFEPEACARMVEGMEFHRFYFNLGKSAGPVNVTMTRPHVRLMGDAAVVSYVRLTQRLDENGRPVTAWCEETRVWQRQQGTWLHVHFHRSMNG